MKRFVRKFKSKRFRNKLRINIVKVFFALNVTSFLFLAVAVDSFTVWWPYLILLGNLFFIGLIGYATNREEINEDWRVFRKRIRDVYGL